MSEKSEWWAALAKDFESLQDSDYWLHAWGHCDDPENDEKRKSRWAIVGNSRGKVDETRELRQRSLIELYVERAYRMQVNQLSPSQSEMIFSAPLPWTGSLMHLKQTGITSDTL